MTSDQLLLLALQYLKYCVCVCVQLNLLKAKQIAMETITNMTYTEELQGNIV